jgi:cell division protein FtsB
MFDERVRKLAFIVLLAALLFQLLFAEGGLIGYLKLRREVGTLEASVKKLEQDNRSMAEQIERLKKDDTFVEELARKQGFVRDGEKLYRSE